MKHRKLISFAAGASALVLPIGVAGAQTAETTTTPAPPGSSEAVALNVLDIVEVGHTQASASQSSAEGSANALALNGEPVIEGSTGGSQQGPGHNEGSLLDTGDTPAGRVMVTPWSVTVEDDGETRSSESDAALLKLVLVNSGVASVNVLHTHSEASHTDERSTGKTSSDGVRANVGGEEDGVTVTVLHSETSSEEEGSSSYLLGVNDTKVGTSDSGGTCVVSAPGVITLACLQAEGGEGSSSAAAAQAEVDALGGAPLDIVAGTSEFGEGETTPIVDPAELPRSDDVDVVATSASTGSGLAVTGSDVAIGFGAGFALVALGMALLQLRRLNPLAS
ncbi:MAG: hypothetical protein KY395_06915 [Actinobacteria bacterium]|nr:hypothetical protein [Actinomycetota bacterium]